MLALNGNTDLTLVKWLMQLGSAGEVADLINTYYPSKPHAAAFTSEFLRCASAPLTPSTHPAPPISKTCQADCG